MRIKLLIGIVFLLIISIQPALSACGGHNTPKLILNDYYELAEGSRFSLNVESSVIENRTTYFFTNINSSFKSFKIQPDGGIVAIPKYNDVGVHRILITGLADNDCLDSKLVTFKVWDRPELEVRPKRGTIEANEGQELDFSATAKDSDDENITFQWYVKDEHLGNNSEFTYTPSYNQSGIYTLKVIAKDSKNLTDIASWNLSIKNINRPPVVVMEIPDIDMPMNTSNDLIDLNLYFVDPDGDEITLSYEEADVQYNTTLKPIPVELKITEGILTVTVPSQIGYQFFKFTATDTSNASASGGVVKIKSYRTTTYIGDFCGDSFCSPAENCEICYEDCGPCEVTCEPTWECTEWSICSPTGLQIRDCVDTNECRETFDKPPEAQECIPLGSCEDKVKNQNETGIDCGGVCGLCPTCEDGIRNQGETKIDCGGPCDPCPTCSDTIKNQNETDVDCGGPCNSCGPGMKCDTNFDCNSFVCEDTCLQSTCEDKVRNQKEDDIDCGGPCNPCPTCKDKIRNQGEEDIDCGGPCSVCPTCFDAEKNQDERLIDCGGTCRGCTFGDYVDYLQFKHFFLMIVVIMIIGLLILKYLSNRTSYKKEFAFLESDQNLDTIIKLNNFIRPLRLRHKKIDHFGATEKAINELKIPGLDKEKLKIIYRDYYKKILPLSPEADYDEIHKSIKASKIPRLVKSLMTLLLRKMWIVGAESVLLPGEIQRIKEESIRILEELRKDIA